MNRVCCCCIPLRFGILLYAYLSLVIYVVIFVFGGAIGVVMFVKHSDSSRRSVILVSEPESAEESSDLSSIENRTNSNDSDYLERKDYNMSKDITGNKSDDLLSFKRRLWRNPINENFSRHKPCFREDWVGKAYRNRLTKDKKFDVGIFSFCAMVLSLIMIIILAFLIYGIHRENVNFIGTYIVLKCIILTVFFLGATVAGYFFGPRLFITLPFLLFEVYMLFTVYAYFDE